MPRVLMLVANPWRVDSRVVREARAIAEAGYTVDVICQGTDKILHRECVDDVTYHSLPTIAQSEYLTRIPGLLKFHYRLLMHSCAQEWKDKSREGHLRRASFPVLSLAASLFKVMTLGALLILPGVVLSPLLILRRIARTKFSETPQSHPALRRINRFFLQPMAKIVLFFLRLAHIDSMRYLNQFGVRAYGLGVHLKPDIVHAHDLNTLSGAHAISVMAGAKLIYDAHELETHTNYWGLSTQTRQWIKVYERVLCRCADSVITVCESIADWLKENYEIRRPVVVHNSPDIESIPNGSTTKETLRQRIGLERSIPLAVYVGSVTIDRGLEICVKALASVPDLHFALVGPRYPETEKEILQTAAGLRVSNRVHLVDPVPSTYVTQFISDADCSVIAIQNVCLSYYFCFPNKLLESVLADIPVVAARLIELENFIQRFHTGIIADETDPEDIARAIQSVIANKERFLPSLETRREIVAEYGWSHQRRKLLDLYSRILAPAAIGSHR